MSKFDKNYNTQYLDFPLGEKRCCYCGKVIDPDIEWDEYDRHEYFHCNCPDALKELEILKEIDRIEEQKIELRRSIPKTKYKKEYKTILVQIDSK